MSEPTFEELKGQVLEIIKAQGAPGERNFQLGAITEPVEEYLRQTYNEPAKQEYANLLNDVLWDLMLRGIIAPFSHGNRNWPWIHVTEYGWKCLDEGALLAYDPTGFLAEVHRLVPDLDKVAYTYLGESVAALNRELFLSSTITLGTASERLILILLAEYADALTPTSRERFSKKVDKRRIGASFEELEKSFKTKAGSGAIPDEYEHDFTTYIQPIFTLYRLHRNAAGHPTGTAVRRGKVVYV